MHAPRAYPGKFGGGAAICRVLHVAAHGNGATTGADVTATPPEPVARLLRAANANDIDAFLAGFTADGVVDDWGREFAGADAIRA